MRYGILKKAVVSAALALTPVAAEAAVDIELALAIDASSSITDAEFAMQRNAYVNILNDPTVLPRDGSVAIGVYRFATTVTTIFPMAVIDDVSIVTLINSLNAMMHPKGATNISGAFIQATYDIFNNAIASNRQVINVSTDGQNNVGNLAFQRANALTAGIDQINCIAVGIGVNCNPVIGGAGAFIVQVDSFTDFEPALRGKIVRELAVAVPEPGTWAMMVVGFGLVGSGVRRRRALGYA